MTPHVASPIQFEKISTRPLTKKERSQPYHTIKYGPNTNGQELVITFVFSGIRRSCSAMQYSMVQTLAVLVCQVERGSVSADLQQTQELANNNYHVEA